MPYKHKCQHRHFQLWKENVNLACSITSRNGTYLYYNNNKKYVPTYIHMHPYVHTSIHSYIHKHTYMHTYIHTQTQIHTNIYIYTYTHTYIHTNTYTQYIHAYIRTHSYRYIHIQGVSQLQGITAGSDFLGLYDQKSSSKYVSDFGRLRSYDRLKLRVGGKDY